MAVKRMIHRSLFEMDAFSALSYPARILYIHMVLTADDQGFIGDPVKLCRYLSIQKKALQQLSDARLIHCFENGVAVVNHWFLHNDLPPSRVRPSIHTKEFSQLTLLPGGVYVLTSELTDSDAAKVALEEVKKAKAKAKAKEKANLKEVKQERGADEADGDDTAQHGESGTAQPDTAAAEKKEAGEEVRADSGGDGIPTAREVREYAEQQGYTHIDPDYFYRFFEARGWKTKNGTPLRWRLRLGDWEAKDREKAAGCQSERSGSQSDRRGSFDTDDFFNAACRRSFDDFD